MGARNAEVALDARLSKELTRRDTGSGIAVKDLQLDLAPYGAAVSAEYGDQRDRLRAAQRGVTLT